jgi:hypothetical protein
MTRVAMRCDRVLTCIEVSSGVAGEFVHCDPLVRMAKRKSDATSVASHAAPSHSRLDSILRVRVHAAFNSEHLCLCRLSHNLIVMTQ